MSRPIKAVLIAVGLVLLCVLVYAGYVYRDFRLESEAAERVRTQKEPVFQALLAQYQSALQIGTARAEVLRYLQTRTVAYLVDGQGKILVVIGEERDVFPCDRWRIYVSFDFYKSVQGAPSPTDRLRAISLSKESAIVCSS